MPKGRIRQALSQVKCFKGKGCYKEPGIGLLQKMKERAANRKGERAIKRETKENAKTAAETARAKMLTKGPNKPFERDMPGDVHKGLKPGVSGAKYALTEKMDGSYGKSKAVSKLVTKRGKSKEVAIKEKDRS